jgi:glycosyltransferase involved in cell wall biosynthesis
MRAHLKIPPTSPVILFLGGISKEKGTDTILQAFEKLLKRQPNSYLIIAGAHPYEHDTRFALHYILSPSARYLEQIRAISKRLGNHVIFTGPSRKIPSLMALSTVVVFPASVGHFARPIIEAACMAKPVIASALPPLQELVIDQTTGYLLPPHDIDAWTDHLEKIIIHPSLAAKLGNHAYHLSTRYHSDIYAKKISTIYKTILKGTHE